MFKDKKVLAGGAVLFAAAFWFYIKPNYMDSAPVAPPTREEVEASPHPTVFLGKPDEVSQEAGAAPDGLILNLKSPSGAPAYAKVIMALEFQQPVPPWVGVSGDALAAKNAEYAHHLQPEMHKILDTVATVVGSKTAEVVGTVEGREELKTELIEAINEHLHEDKVEQIYFETFITQ